MASLEQKVKYIYNSNRLDGVHVPYEKTLALALEPPDPLGDSVDLVGMDDKMYDRAVVLSHMQALFYVEKLGRDKRVITESELRDIHRRLMEGVILSGGEFRECTLNYKAVPPVPPEQIARRLKRVLDLMNLGFDRARSKEMLAWQVHHEFLFVHPFIEGNGRTARLLLNLVRFRAGLDLELVPFAEHEKYLRSIVDYGRKLSQATNGQYGIRDGAGTPDAARIAP
jgi:Fic family protein